MDLHQGLNWAVLWSPSSAISKVPATPTPPPPLLSAVRCHPLCCATRPTQGPGAGPSPAYSRLRQSPPASLCTAAFGSRCLGAPTRLGRPLRLLLSMPLGVRQPQLRPRPQPRGERRGARIWAGLPGFLTQRGPLFSTSRTVFLSHFLAGGGVRRAPPGTGPALGPGAPPPPPQPRRAPPSARPRPRPLARSSRSPYVLSGFHQALLFSTVLSKDEPLI